MLLIYIDVLYVTNGGTYDWLFALCEETIFERKRL